jgi:hypothetical protein
VASSKLARLVEALRLVRAFKTRFAPAMMSGNKSVRTCTAWTVLPLPCRCPPGPWLLASTREPCGTTPHEPRAPRKVVLQAARTRVRNLAAVVTRVAWESGRRRTKVILR